MSAVVAIAVILLLIGVAVWAARTKPSSSNRDDNGDAARRYGPGL